VNDPALRYVVSDEEGVRPRNGDLIIMRSKRYWAVPLLGAAAAAGIAACGSSSPSSSSTGSPPASPQANSGASVSATGIATRHTGLGTVLVDSQGHTLYWFSIDTPTKSNCTGSCLQFWLPAQGKASVASGTSLPKAFGTITGANGKVQATYAGHPLYTYIADTAAGQTKGNGTNLSGGLWWAMTPTATIMHGTGAAPSPTKSGSGGGGYGY